MSEFWAHSSPYGRSMRQGLRRASRGVQGFRKRSVHMQLSFEGRF